mgnify:CR=1 FL=1
MWYPLKEKSRPARGAWVEIRKSLVAETGTLSSRPARGAWVEIRKLLAVNSGNASRPARGAWVEMSTSGRTPLLAIVAPRKGRVG